ncbi:bacillithiol biosynthesis deacetylase BshB2 [Pseudogracilibacillus sp. ICA-222130]|uniref:bacillithiol biosynthesis deacetylase BshB2 n=1 Tax=Pseudogracilibacillus sp. ICA-222130 TaxID=3134655 RepID=UPI0030BEC990
MEKHTHVVIVYPHPDDESFGGAGTIYKCKEAGVPVTYLCGTLGQMGRNMGTPPFANRETLYTFREKELEDACKFLGIDYKLLGYRDKTLEFENKVALAAHIKSVLEEINPSLVITHYPEHGVHPDHNALGEATIEAVRLMNPENRPTVWASAITNDFEKVLGEPDVTIALNDDMVKFKLGAIFEHKSQAQGMLEKMNEENPSAETKDYLERMKDRLGKERFYIWKYD